MFLQSLQIRSNFGYVKLDLHNNEPHDKHHRILHKEEALGYDGFVSFYRNRNETSTYFYGMSSLPISGKQIGRCTGV